MSILLNAIKPAFHAIIYLSLFFLSGSRLYSQNLDWEDLQIIGGTGTESLSSFEILPNGQMILGGTFSQNLEIDGTTLESVGESDALVVSINADNSTNWILAGGGVLDEEINAISSDQDGNILVVGSYWSNATFGNTSISTTDNPKGLFILKIDTTGTILWNFTINGTTLKGATDITTDEDGNSYICGFFENQLFLGQDTLQATGASDLFLIKLNSEGQLEWYTQAGLTGDTRATSLELNSQGHIVIGGFYTGSVVFNTDSLVANTKDRDVFIATFDGQGAALWGRKAGGVHDDELTDIKIALDDMIYATGYFVGVMNLGEGVSIASNNGNSDFYLLNYAANGQPLAARAFGGSLIQQSTALSINGGVLAVSGHYQGAMTIDNIQIEAGETVSGFFAGFNLDLEPRWLTSINSNGNLFASNVCIAPDGLGYFVGGSFSGSATFPPSTFSSSGGFDMFLSRTEFIVVSDQEVEKQAPLRIFPNPVSDILHIETPIQNYDLAILNSAGKLILQGHNTRQINVDSLPAGNYLLHLQNESVQISKAFIKD